MYVWQNTIVDETGLLRVNAHVEVRDAETAELVTIYADVDGVTELANPFTARAGFALFYAEAGLYEITALDDALERIWSDVLLGAPSEKLPDLSTIITPIVESVLDPSVDALLAAIAATPALHNFTVLATGASSDKPDGWTTSKTATSRYSVVVTLGHTNYHVDPTVVVPTSGDRLYSVALLTKTGSGFTYVVKSIHDEASDTDAAVALRVTDYGA